MSDEIKKNTELDGAVAADSSAKKLHTGKKQFTGRKSAAEAAHHVTEGERDERIASAQARIRENIEKAGREAAERRELAEAKNDYKASLIERENKKADAERRERMQKAREERERIAAERALEREEYLRREREESERASGGVSSILARLGSSGSDSATHESSAESLPEDASVIKEETALYGAETAEEAKSEEIAKGAEETVLDGEAEISEPSEADGAHSYDGSLSSDGAPSSESDSEAPSAADEAAAFSTGDADGKSEAPIESAEPVLADTDASAEKEKENKSASVADDSLIINIGGGTAAPRAPSGVTLDGGILTIPAPVFHAPYYGHSRPRADFSGELRAAEEKHIARRRAAVYEAAGIYSEELRLLAEEEARYAAEIADIKARRSEYGELLAELDGCDPNRYGYAPEGAREVRGATDGDGYRGIGYLERMGDTALAGAKLGEEELLREYEKYRESLDRAAGSPREPKGEALPYTDAALRYAPEDKEFRCEPRYEEYDGELFAERYHSTGVAEPYAADLGRYSPEGYGLESDRAAVRDYESAMARKQRSERRASDKSERAEGELGDLERRRLEEAEHNEHKYRTEGIDFYAKNQLSKRLDKFYKEEALLLKRQKKLSREQAKASPEENAALIVEKLAIAKELCEMAADALGACVYVGSRTRTGKHKRLLSSYVDSYNRICDEYERQTGRPLDRVDQSMVEDVMAGRLYQPIQNVYYHGMEDDVVHAGITPETEREHRLETEDSLIADEYARYVNEGAFPDLTVKEKRAASKRRSERMSAVRRAAERDVILIGLRTEYRIAELEARRDVLTYSYDLDKSDRSAELRKIEKKINRIRASERRATDLEREDNSRYYYLAAVDAREEKVKSGARRERLEALRLRLDVLLAERESINERLIALYGGSDNRFKRAKIARKAGGVRKKAAKSMFKSQRDLARKIDKIKAPVDMKERAMELLNKRISDAAEYEAAKYTLKKLRPLGRARDELVRTIKSSKKSLKSHEREIRYMLKKLKKQEERYRSDREWAGFLIILFLVIGLGAFAWMTFGDEVIAYINELRAYFGI